jgi:hypothetical protein
MKVLKETKGENKLLDVKRRKFPSSPTAEAMMRKSYSKKRLAN